MFKEASIKFAVQWWMNLIRQEEGSLDSANPGGETDIFVSFLRSETRVLTSEDPGVFDRFEEVLKKKILDAEEREVLLDVDYHPSGLLLEAVESSGLDDSHLPIKTWMRLEIGKAGETIVSYANGYGGKIEERVFST